MFADSRRCLEGDLTASFAKATAGHGSGVEGWAKEEGPRGPRGKPLPGDDSVNLRGFLRRNRRRFPLWGLRVGGDGDGRGGLEVHG